VVNQTTCGLLKTTVFPVSNIVVTEGFPDSLKSAVEASGIVGGTAALQGTTLNVTFTNLDTGVSYYVPASFTATTGTAVLLAVSGPGSTTAAATVANAAGATGFILVTAAAPTVYYQVSGGGGTGNTDVFIIGVTASVPSVSAVPTFSTSPVGASIVLSGAAAPAYPGYAGTITYASTLASATQTNGLITPCATTLLFPYVTNAAGFDTGLAIANASSVPAASGIPATALAPTTGTCSLTFYGPGAATASPVTVPYGTVTTGTVGTPIAMGGSSTAAAGLTGYAVAVCNFVGAHGYAFISDALGTGSGVAASYVATILQSGNDLYAPAPAGTITPTN
jgi:hypothetical protein